MLGSDRNHLLTALLRTGFLILATLGASGSARAQVPLESTPRWTAGAEEGVPALPGPRRTVPFTSAALPLQAEAQGFGASARIRPRTTGALIGGVIGGVIGFAAGYPFDNIEGGDRVGSLTLAGAAGGALIGAALGGAVGWLAER